MGAYLGFKGTVQKCPHHDLPPWYGLYVFYGGLEQDNKKELDMLSGASFMELTTELAWICLDKVHKNRVSWGFGLESGGEIEIEYDYLNSYKNTEKIKETANELNLDDVMVLDVLQAFTEFIELPKKEWLHYTPPPQVVEVTQVEAEVPKVVPIEMSPYNEPLPYPMAAERHIRAQLLDNKRKRREEK